MLAVGSLGSTHSISGVVWISLLLNLAKIAAENLGVENQSCNWGILSACICRLVPQKVTLWYAVCTVSACNGVWRALLTGASHFRGEIALLTWDALGPFII
jgi:hypothetical protein